VTALQEARTVLSHASYARCEFEEGSAVSLEGKRAGRHAGLAAVLLLRAELGKPSNALTTETPTSPTYTIINYWHQLNFHDVKEV